MQPFVHTHRLGPCQFSMCVPGMSYMCTHKQTHTHTHTHTQIVCTNTHTTHTLPFKHTSLKKIINTFPGIKQANWNWKHPSKLALGKAISKQCKQWIHLLSMKQENTNLTTTRWDLTKCQIWDALASCWLIDLNCLHIVIKFDVVQKKIFQTS